MSLTSLGGFLSDDAPEGLPGIAGRFDGNHVLVPLLTPEVSALTDQLKVATTLARATGAALSVIDPITVPEQTPRTVDSAVSDATDDALLNWAFDQADDSTPQLDGDLLHTRNVATGVLGAVRTSDVDTLVLPGRSRSHRFRKGVVERIAVHVECDVVVVNGRPGYEKVPSILLPVAGGPHSGFAADLAQAVATDCDAWIDVLHVVDDEASAERRDAAEELVDDVYRRIGRPETTTTWMLEADDVAEAIIEQSRCYGLTIIGAPTKGRLRQFILGSTSRTVRTNAGSVVLSVRNNSRRSTGDG